MELQQAWRGLERQKLSRKGDAPLSSLPPFLQSVTKMQFMVALYCSPNATVHLDLQRMVAVNIVPFQESLSVLFKVGKQLCVKDEKQSWQA